MSDNREYRKDQRAGSDVAWNNIRQAIESGNADKVYARAKLSKYPYMEEDQPELYAQLVAIKDGGKTERKPKVEKAAKEKKKERNLAHQEEEDEPVLKTAAPKPKSKKKKNRSVKEDDGAEYGKPFAYVMVITDPKDPEDPEIVEARIDEPLQVQDLINRYKEFTQEPTPGFIVKYFNKVNKKGQNRPDWDEITSRKFAEAMESLEVFE